MIRAGIVAKGFWIAVIALVFFAIVRWPEHQSFIGNGFLIAVLLVMGLVAIANPPFFAKRVGAAEWVNTHIFPHPRRTRLLGLIAIIGALLLFWLTIRM